MASLIQNYGSGARRIPSILALNMVPRRGAFPLLFPGCRFCLPLLGKEEEEAFLVSAFCRSDRSVKRSVVGGLSKFQKMENDDRCKSNRFQRTNRISNDGPIFLKWFSK